MHTGISLKYGNSIAYSWQRYSTVAPSQKKRPKQMSSLSLEVTAFSEVPSSGVACACLKKWPKCCIFVKTCHKRKNRSIHAAKLLTPTPKSMTLEKSKQNVWFRSCCLNFIFVLCNLHRHVPCRHFFRHKMVIFFDRMATYHMQWLHQWIKFSCYQID